MMLELHDVRAGYDGSRVLDGMTLRVAEGEKVALLGGNGMGKTTTLRVITGLLRPESGRVVFDGHDLTKLPPHRIAGLRTALVPEGRRIFPAMTVWENLQMGAYLRRRDPAMVRRSLEQVFTCFPVLQERRNQLGGTLSGGEQQMLAVARALMSGPRLLLLDEPSLGLAPMMVREVFKILEDTANFKLTFLIAEQNAEVTLQTCDRAYLVQRGRVVLEGPAAELRRRPELHISYLGQRKRAAPEGEAR